MEDNHSKTTYGKTPHGGVKMVGYFFDKEGKPCEEKEAVTVLIGEYDKDDKCIFSVRSGPNPPISKKPIEML